MILNKNAIEKHLDYLDNDKYYKEFYTALLLYDVLGINKEDLTDEEITRVYKLQDEYQSIYNEDLRERLLYELDFEEDEEDEEI